MRSVKSSARHVLLLCSLSAVPTQTAAADWGNHPLWDDGFAEVATYEAQRLVYGKLRTFETVLITVKEDFGREYYTKADPPYAGKEIFPVLKLNIASEIQTENYPYSYLTSIFVNRDNILRLVKMTHGSQEWCGNTFKLVKTWGPTSELIFHSYWEGEGDGRRPLEWGPNSLAEDQLFLALRALPFSEGYTWAFRLLPTQITNKVSRTELEQAVARVVGQEAVALQRGKSICWRVDLEFGETKQSYWFEKTYPNMLVQFRSSDGRQLRLVSQSRKKYWERP